MATLKEALFQELESLNSTVIEFRHHLHEHPELSNKEEKTTALIKKILSESGLRITTYETHYGLIAELITDESRPFIALRADIDALPIHEQTFLPYASDTKGIMHACGHDSHAAVLLGIALAFAQLKRPLNANLRFIFQPAEEVLDGGAPQMIEDGVLDKVKAIFGLHAYPYLKTGQIGYKYGVMLASADMFTIEIKGKSSHGARPHEGVDAILVTSMVVNALNHIVSRQIDPLHPAVISLGTIEGGKAPNVLCDYVRLTGTVRTVNHDIRKQIPEMMRVTMEGICRSMHASFEFDYEFGTPEVKNDKAMVDLLVNEAKSVIGENNCIDLEDPVMGGEDFGFYLEQIPGAFIRLGTCSHDGDNCFSQHNSRFNVDDNALIIGMKVLSATALKALDDL
jgi:amidohydrolase